MMYNDPLRNNYDEASCQLKMIHKSLASIAKHGKENSYISPGQAKYLAKANKLISDVYFGLNDTALRVYGLRYKRDHRIKDL